MFTFRHSQPLLLINDVTTVGPFRDDGRGPRAHVKRLGLRGRCCGAPWGEFVAAFLWLLVFSLVTFLGSCGSRLLGSTPFTFQIAVNKNNEIVGKDKLPL